MFFFINNMIYHISTVDRSTLKSSIDNATSFKNDNLLSESGKLSIENALKEANEVYGNVLATKDDIDEAFNSLNLVVEGIETLEKVNKPINKTDIDALIEATEVSTSTKGCKGSACSTIGFMASLLAIKKKKR